MGRRRADGRAPRTGAAPGCRPGGDPGPGRAPAPDPPSLSRRPDPAHPLLPPGRSVTADPGTSTPRRPRASRPPRSAINARLLSATDGPPGSTPLHVEVQRNLEHLWQTGGRRGATAAAGRRPDWILIRPE